MKKVKVYVVYNPNVQEPNMGKLIKVFDFEYHAAVYAEHHGLQIIEKTLIEDLVR